MKRNEYDYSRFTTDALRALQHKYQKTAHKSANSAEHLKYINAELHDRKHTTKGILGFGILPIGRHHSSRPHSSKRFIQKAIKHRGSLHKFAAKHRALNQNDTINLTKTKHAAMKLPGKKRTHRLRQITLAKRLREYNRK